MNRTRHTINSTDNHAEDIKGGTVSRRALLAGSAGLALSSVGIAHEAAAEHPHGAAGNTTRAASHSNAVGSLSQRAYSVPTPVANDISHDPSSVPPPVGKREPETIRVDLETREVEARLDQRATFRFWTFNGTVPGPMVRVRVGDTVEVHLKNSEDSWMMHNVDFHAVTGPGGGAEATNFAPC